MRDSKNMYVVSREVYHLQKFLLYWKENSRDLWKLHIHKLEASTVAIDTQFHTL